MTPCPLHSVRSDVGDRSALVSPPHPTTLLILGAGGYLGHSLARYFHNRQGWHVVGLFHRQPVHRCCDTVAVRDIFVNDFTDLIPHQGRVVLINAAFDFREVGNAVPDSKYRYLEAAVASLAHRHDCMCINISSMSAFPGCRSDYGREKLVVEHLFARHRGINVRPGLIASWEQPGSAFLHLIRIVQDSLIVPYLVSRDDGFFVCGLNDLLAGIDGLVAMNLNKPHTVSFCYAHRLRLVDILQAIRRRRSLQRLLVPVPWRLAYWLLALKERMSGRGKVRADSIVDFGFPATTAHRRHFFANVVRRRQSTNYRAHPSKPASDDFSFLEG